MTLTGYLPERGAADILAGRTSIVLGGRAYYVPALTIAQSETWLAQVDGDLSILLASVADAGDDLGAILSALQAAPDRLLDLLYAYDLSHVLPEREALREAATKSELLTAILEVWRTENPLVGLALAGMTSGLLASAPSRPTNGSPPATAGRRSRSGRH